MSDEQSLQSMSDNDLLRRVVELTGQSRRVEADLVAHVGEIDRRRLYAREACPSMFVYCTGVLHLSDAEAYLRIAAARAAREHPALLTMLADGRLHLSGIALLAPHLTADNRDSVLQRAVHRSKRQIEELVAELSPRPDAAAVIRKLPVRHTHPGAAAESNAAADTERREMMRPQAGPTAGCGSVLCPDGVAGGHSHDTGRNDPVATPTDVDAPNRPFRTAPAAVQPLAPARYKVQFTAGEAFRDKLERLQALMRSAVPDGDLAAIIEDAVTEKLRGLEARRFAVTDSPRATPPATDVRTSSRHIPAAVRRAVRERDGGQCRFVDDGGRRCPARNRLEFHHRHPYGYGGDHSPENISLMCRAHNGYLAEVDYGVRDPRVSDN